MTKFFFLAGVVESNDDDIFGYYFTSILPVYCTILDDQEITIQDNGPTAAPATNQIALLCGLQNEHFKNLKQDHITPMETLLSILAYILFAASKLDSGNIAIVKPEFFEQGVALDSLQAFILGDTTSWNILVFLINSSKKFVNWCICLHQKDESTTFFDPAVKQGDSLAMGQTYRSRRKQLLCKVNAAIEKLYEVLCFFFLSLSRKARVFAFSIWIQCKFLALHICG